MTARATITVGRAPRRSRAASLRVDALDGASLRLQWALSQVETLRQQLTSSQQESAIAQRQLELLTIANLQLRDLAVRREHEVACSLSPRWYRTDSCLSAGLDPKALERIDQLATRQTRFSKGDHLYRAGEEFTSLYLIRTGSCKTVLLARDGQDQVAGYHMTGEFIGTDGIGSAVHHCQAIALETTEVGVLPFEQIEALAMVSGRLQHNLHKMLSDETVRAQELMILLGRMCAGQRLAVFLLDLSRRHAARGYSSCEFVLRMTREDIGSYLGLTLETVSRTLSRFQSKALIQVRGRSVQLLDRAALNRLVDCDA